MAGPWNKAFWVSFHKVAIEETHNANIFYNTACEISYFYDRVNTKLMTTASPATLLRQFNGTISQWIDYLDEYTLDMLLRQPHPDSWSLGQVYMHIIRDTAWFVVQMETSLLYDANSEEEMHENTKAIFRNNGFPDRQLENPANAGMLQSQSKAALLQELAAIREKVNRLYTAFDFSTSTGKTEHPGFRFFNAMEWLQFAEMHLRHHGRQKQRIDDVLFTR